MLRELWRGEIPLLKTFWIYGVLGVVLLGLLSQFLLNRPLISGKISGILFISLVAIGNIGYLILVAVGIWRSAWKYVGHRAWSYSARAVVIIAVLANITMVLLAGYGLYGFKDINDPGKNSCNIESTLNSSSEYPLVGFWKGNCSENFGLAVAPVEKGFYSISFCGPGGCFKPGTYRPNSRLTDDPSYKIIDNDTIEVKGRDGFTRYHRCSKANMFISSKLSKAQPHRAPQPADCAVD